MLPSIQIALVMVFVHRSKTLTRQIHFDSSHAATFLHVKMSINFKCVGFFSFLFFWHIFLPWWEIFFYHAYGKPTGKSPLTKSVSSSATQHGCLTSRNPASAMVHISEKWGSMLRQKFQIRQHGKTVHRLVNDSGLLLHIRKAHEIQACKKQWGADILGLSHTLQGQPQSRKPSLGQT